MKLKQRCLKTIFILFSFVFLCACAKGNIATNRIENNKKVANAISERIEKENNADAEPTFVSADDINKAKENLERKTDDNIDNTVDFDLTAVSGDMVYASVYQLMTNPDEYVGKTFKVDGTYYATYYEPTNRNYHYVVIEDALACCSQGLEFVWDDGSHVYPDEYPKSQSKVEVTGTFETYTEAGDGKLYCRLANATLREIN